MSLLPVAACLAACTLLIVDSLLTLIILTVIIAPEARVLCILCPALRERVKSEREMCVCVCVCVCDCVCVSVCVREGEHLASVPLLELLERHLAAIIDIH